jgi:hypothetical protein
MKAAKFSAGQNVTLARRKGNAAQPGPFQIVKVMPLGGRIQQYRVKCQQEPYDRIVEEARLEAYQNE